jgi:hypothetical protein
MTENLNETPELEPMPGKKNNRTLWIILAVLGVVILCCCVLAVIGSFLYIPSWYNQFNF